MTVLFGSIAFEFGNMQGTCWGVSRTNVTWLYIQPQHTGTGAVTRIIDYAIQCEQPQGCQETPVSICPHNHSIRRDTLDWFLNKTDTVTFTFLRNPFRRLLSNAVFHQVIGTTGRDEDVMKFRSWILTNYPYPGSPVHDFRRLSSKNTRNHLNWGRHHLEKEHSKTLRAENHFLGISEVMGKPRPSDMYGRVSHLTEDLVTILKRIGFNTTDIDGYSPLVHCISSCGEIDDVGLWTNTNRRHNYQHLLNSSTTSQRINVLSPAKKFMSREWYDNETTEAVLNRFQNDFLYYNFSWNPANMWRDNE